MLGYKNLNLFGYFAIETKLKTSTFYSEDHNKNEVFKFCLWKWMVSVGFLERPSLLVQSEIVFY